MTGSRRRDRGAPPFVRWSRAALRVPLLHKIVAANAAVVAVGAAAGTAVTHSLARSPDGPEPAVLVIAFAAAGLVISVVLNTVIVAAALAPLRQLASAARRVEEGDLEARVPDSPLADRELSRLARVFNRMVEAVARHRRRLRRLALRALEDGERERRRLSRALSDDAAQRLAGLLMLLGSSAAEDDPWELKGLCRNAREEVAALLEDLRKLARSLRPPELEDVGVHLACRAYARGVADRSGFGLQFRGEPVDARLSEAARLALYRIVQEAVDNVAAHADPGKVTITIRATDDGGVEAAVEDDGRGFDVARATDGDEGSLGLFSMRERAAMVGGSVEIVSRPGGGTRVLARLGNRGGGRGERLARDASSPSFRPALRK